MTEMTLPQLHHANAHFVTPQLAIGGDLSSNRALAKAQLAELVEAGITHILDVRIEWSDERRVREEAPDVAYLHRGIDDRGQRVPDAWFDEVTAWALQALADPGAKLLTHCHMGINRGPSTGYAILLAQGWDPIEAIDAIRGRRDIAYVAYAEDALRWHHERTQASPRTRVAQRAGLAVWRKQNDLDQNAVIRRVRLAEDEDEAQAS